MFWIKEQSKTKRFRRAVVRQTWWDFSNSLKSFQLESKPTCSWSQQPAIQVTSSHRKIKHQSPLAVHGIQDVLHCYRCVWIRLLLARLPLHQEISKGSCTTPLCHCQGLVVVACGVQRSALISGWSLKSFRCTQRQKQKQVITACSTESVSKVCWRTEADKDPLESLVAGGLQVKQRKLVICAVLGFVADGLKQRWCSVKLRINNGKNALRHSWIAHLPDKNSVQKHNKK